MLRLGRPPSASARPWRYVCTDGAIQGGTYDSVLVTGDCNTPDEATPVTIKGNLALAPGSTLNGLTADLTNVNMATVHVGVNVQAGGGARPRSRLLDHHGRGSVLPVPEHKRQANSDVGIGGNIMADGPLVQYLDGITVHGDLISNGRSPGPDVTRTNPAFDFPVKDNTIGGNLVVNGWTGGLVAELVEQDLLEEVED